MTFTSVINVANCSPFSVEVKIRSANAGRANADQHLIVLNFGERNHLEMQILRAVQYTNFCFHERLLEFQCYSTDSQPPSM